MKINLIDSCFAHTPMGQICDFYASDKIQWERCPDLLPRPTVVTDGNIPQEFGHNHIALLLEPRELIPHIYKFVENNFYNYHTILTHDLDLARACPNATRYTFGGCWIEPDDVAIHDKSKDVSIIVSDKRQTIGHQLRHNIVGRLGDKLDVYGRGYTPVAKKIEALRDYRFSVVIENVARDDFFTEKLIDCFATGTVPLYWGMPGISRCFNDKGIIQFHSIGQLHRILSMLEGDWETNYEYRRAAIEENFKLCKKYFATEDSIYNALQIVGVIP